MHTMSSMSYGNQQSLNFEFSIYASYKISKIKEKFSDCQDSYGLSDDKLKIAISDGATQSFYSGPWAQILCNSYCSWPNPLSMQCWTEWLSSAQEKWINNMNQKLVELREQGKPSWIECLNGLEMKKDAFATFIGIRLDSSYIRGMAIGDSCALLIKHAAIDSAETGHSNSFTIVRAFPGLWRNTFSNNTIGLSSYTSYIAHMPEFFDVPIPQDGESYLIVLMTDAMAEYVMKKEMEGSSVVSELLALKNDEQFFEYVSAARNHGLANDDTTLVIAGITCRMPPEESQYQSPDTSEIQPEQLPEISQIISSESEAHSSPLHSIVNITQAGIVGQLENDCNSDNQSEVSSSFDFSNQRDPASIRSLHNEADSQQPMNLDKDTEGVQNCAPDMSTLSITSTSPSIEDAQSRGISVRHQMTHSDVTLPPSGPKKKRNKLSLRNWLRGLVRHFF